MFQNPGDQVIRHGEIMNCEMAQSPEGVIVAFVEGLELRLTGFQGLGERLGLEPDLVQFFGD